MDDAWIYEPNFPMFLKSIHFINFQSHLCQRWGWSISQLPLGETSRQLITGPKYEDIYLHAHLHLRRLSPGCMYSDSGMKPANPHRVAMFKGSKRNQFNESWAKKHGSSFSHSGSEHLRRASPCTEHHLHNSTDGHYNIIRPDPD